MTDIERGRAFLVQHLNAGRSFIISSAIPLRPLDILPRTRIPFWSDTGILLSIVLEHPFRILRECTYDEFTLNTPPEIPEAWRVPREIAMAHGWTYYEIVTD